VDSVYFAAFFSCRSDGSGPTPLGVRTFDVADGRFEGLAYDRISGQTAMLWQKSVRHSLSVRVGDVAQFLNRTDREIGVSSVDLDLADCRFGGDGRTLFVLSRSGALFALETARFTVEAVLTGSASIAGIAPTLLDDGGLLLVDARSRPVYCEYSPPVHP
jgi:hypothetical protein